MYIDLNELEVKKAHLGKARFALDLSDGSERGEYVNQDYILNTLHRPHRAVNLMYCYYPLDETWPARAREAFKDQVIEFQWDYPYDDYFTYGGGLEGNRNREGEPFEQMRDVRRHGQDVILTMTIDPWISDDQLLAIGEDLAPFGRMQLRVNHEATGDWFSFTKRATDKEIAAFYMHAMDVIKTKAPQVEFILCIGGVEDPPRHLDEGPADADSPMVKEDEYKKAVAKTDIWSVDKYMALHWGWPIDVADETTNQYGRSKVSRIYKLTRLSYDRFMKLSDNKSRPMVMSEFNADGDVVGPYEQVDMIKEFFALREADPEDWLTAITFYQFRDRGRLGLEMEDPNNPDVGIPTPSLAEYKKLLNSPLCLPKIDADETIDLSSNYELRWGGSEDSDGLMISYKLDKAPTFFELYFDEDTLDSNLMIKVNNRWFYKKPGAKFVDLMPLFFEYPDTSLDTTITFFAPPESGMNVDDGSKDWMINQRVKLAKLPKLRIEYGPVLK
ncbi:MAG: hypothetical protein K5656_11800 [Lachnospiraceae bacterium]|nr:hypothetical protein [Lachnospiraceae bacterium]